MQSKLSHSKEQPKVQDNMAKDIIIIDWRKKMALPSIKNQGTAECCWAISSADAVASCKALRGTSVTLSPQHLIDVAYINHKVNGSFQVSWAMDFIRDSGITLEECYPFKGHPHFDKTKIPEFQNLYTVENWGLIRYDNDKISEMLKQGPMVITAHYDKGLRKLDANSIYRPNYELEGDEDYGHAMLLVGEGVRLIGKDKIHLWIVQNSWGENWAENGFGKIVRNYELKVRGYYPILQ
ncbi:uncharacterized protein LOC133037979 [Cannabis sativa]|uniref:uncharacterized protein LOC133037979 n=1 Tax=Cannabis sativa TaxID=3483 RepID=UPI0029C9FEB5|nr:uncharacterized protein LOC133037979 [Cannabis sativa]